MMGDWVWQFPPTTVTSNGTDSQELRWLRMTGGKPVRIWMGHPPQQADNPPEPHQ